MSDYMTTTKIKVRRTAVQTRRLKAAIEMMEDVAKNRREQFNMAYFKTMADAGICSSNSEFTLERSSHSFLNHCGTAACFAGWLTESDEYQKAIKMARAKIDGYFYKYSISSDGAPVLIGVDLGNLDVINTATTLSIYFGVANHLISKIAAIGLHYEIAYFYGIEYDSDAANRFTTLCAQITPEMVIEKLKLCLSGELQ